MASSSKSVIPGIPDEVLFKIDERFAGLDKLRPLSLCSGHVLPRKWNDNDLKEVVIFNGVQLSEQECLSYGKVWVEQMMSGRISKETVLIGLRLACSLPNPDETGWSYVWDRKPQSDTTKPLPVLSLSVPIVHQASGGGQRIGDKTSAAAYTFLSAYCMRLITKPESNLVNSLDNMKSRYQSFFPYSSIIENFVVALDVARMYKVLLSDDIKNTYLMWVIASRVADRSVGRRADRLMNYIAYQVFEYSGMHAYKLLNDVMSKAGVTATTLMENIRSYLWKEAIEDIWEIINNHEKTDAHPNRTVAFRYARLLSPGYFSALQTKSCSKLCYLLAALYNKYVTPTEKANPMNIVGVGNLGEAYKGKLDKGATILFTMFKDMEKTDASASQD